MFSIRFIKFSKLSVWNEFARFPGAHSPSLAFTCTSQNEGEKGGGGEEGRLSFPRNQCQWITWCFYQTELLKSWCHCQQTLTDTSLHPRFIIAAGLMCRWHNCSHMGFFPVHACGPPQDSLTLLWPPTVYLSPYKPLETWHETPIGWNEARNQKPINPNQTWVPNTADSLRPQFIFLKVAEIPKCDSKELTLTQTEEVSHWFSFSQMSHLLLCQLNYWFLLQPSHETSLCAAQPADTELILIITGVSGGNWSYISRTCTVRVSTLCRDPDSLIAADRSDPSDLMLERATQVQMMWGQDIVFWCD